MVEHKLLEVAEGDVLYKQYQLLCSTVAEKKEMSLKYRAFSQETGRLDSFFMTELCGRKEFQQLWELLKVLLTLSHGQAAIERGFSTNKEVMVENLKTHSLVAQRQICEVVKMVRKL